MFLVNEKTGKKYTVVEFDREAQMLTLVGEHNIPFKEKFDKENLKRLGYQLKAA